MNLDLNSGLTPVQARFVRDITFLTDEIATALSNGFDKSCVD